jgi:hypothetical protein
MRFGNIGALIPYYVHNSNINNAVRAVCERVFMVKSELGGFVEPTQPVEALFNANLEGFRRKLGRACGKVESISGKQFVASRIPRKRACYQSAGDSLKISDLKYRDYVWSFFLKAEKIWKEGAPPRGIYPRSARYNYELGKFIAPIEHRLYRGIDKVYGYSVVMKGKNAHEVAGCIRENWEEFNDPVALFLDVSRFDQRVGITALKWEHSVYNKMSGNNSKLQQLLSKQLINTGYAYYVDGKLKFHVEGQRGSGDMNTGCGNVLLMCALLFGYFDAMGVKVRVADNGDDAVVMVERSSIKRVEGSIQDWFGSMGFALKIDGKTDIFERISFCQAQPVYDGTQWVMCRDPHFVLDKDLGSVKRYDNEGEWRVLCNSMGTCGMSLAGNLPVFGAFYGMLQVGGKVRSLETGMEFLARGMDKKREVPSQEARYSFYLAFDITPDEQVCLEETYDSITLGWGTPGAVGIDIQENEIYPTLYLR